MIAREKFQIGDRVRLSRESQLWAIMREPNRGGEVVGFIRGDDRGVKVKLDGRATPVKVCSDYLELADWEWRD